MVIVKKTEISIPLLKYKKKVEDRNIYFFF